MKIVFGKNTTVRFLDEKRRRVLPDPWGTDYWPGSSMEVKDVLSANPRQLHVLCVDGDVGVVELDAVRSIA